MTTVATVELITTSVGLSMFIFCFVNFWECDHHITVESTTASVRLAQACPNYGTFDIRKLIHVQKHHGVSMIAELVAIPSHA